MDETVNGAYLTRCLDRYGLMCNNVVEFASSLNADVNIYNSISTVTANMLKTLPKYTLFIMEGLNFAASLTPPIANSIWGLSSAGRAFTDFHYSAYGIDSFTSLNAIRSPLGKIMKGVGYALIAADLGLNIYDSVQKGYTWEQGIVSFALTGVKDVGVFLFTSWFSNLIGGKIGAAIGGTMGGPIGMVLGTLIGTVVGVLIDLVATVIIDWLVGLFD